MAKTDKKDRPGRTEGGQEATVNMEPINTRMKHLIGLYRKAEEAAKDLSEAIKATAEESGTLAVNVRRLVAAKAGEDFDDTKRKVVQLSLIFEEAEL